MTRAEFMEEVAKAALRFQKRRRRPRVMAETSLDALAVARAADPLRGVRAARRVARCRKRRTNGKLCQAPCVRGATRCRWHGGLRMVPAHAGNVRRFLGGVYARQAAYKMRMKTLGEFWRQLHPLDQQYLREFLTREEWSDMQLVDFAARALLEARENYWAWNSFLLQLRRERKLGFSTKPLNQYR